MVIGLPWCLSHGLLMVIWCGLQLRERQEEADEYAGMVGKMAHKSQADKEKMRGVLLALVSR